MRRRSSMLLTACVAAAMGASVAVALPAQAHDDYTNGLTRAGHDSPLSLTGVQVAAREVIEESLGTDHVNTSNVQLMKRIPLTADGVGARVVGHWLYVTSTKDLQIFDITDPGNPQRVGGVTADIEFENEQVPTDGRILGISGQTSTVTTQQGACQPDVDASADTTYKANCLAIFDVRNKQKPVQVAAVGGSGDHTSTCIHVGTNSCAFMYGSRGSITDLRQVLASGHKARRLTTNWQAQIAKQGYPKPVSCHNQTELRPGILLTACEPISLISVRPEDGGSVTNPKVLGTASFHGAPDDKDRFVHGVEWAQRGTDHLMLAGGETNFTGKCEPDAGAFSTFVNTGTPMHPNFRWADQYRPHSGTYTDGNPPDGVYSFGCSVHWFQPNPTFKDHGLVALASYENGTRFLQITRTGQIKEVGWFEPLGGSTSSPDWAPDNRTVYAVDYHRGLDVLRWKGSFYNQ